MRERIIILIGLVTSHASSNCEIAYSQSVMESALLRVIEQVDVPAPTAGVLSEIHVQEGDTVSSGGGIAQIDDSHARLIMRRAEIELKLSQDKAKDDVALRAAKHSLAFAQSESARLDRAAMGLPGSISQSQLEEAKFKIGKAEFESQSAVNQIRQNQLSVALKEQEVALGKYEIDLRRVTSPLSGVVVEVMRHKGEWVEPGDKVVRIVRIDRLRAEGLIAADQIQGERQGKSAYVATEVGGRAERRFPGKIVFVSPEVNPINGLVHVSVDFDNKENATRPGMKAKIIISPAPIDTAIQ